MFCSNCGSQVADTAAFCANCGTSVNQAPAQSARQQAGAAQAAGVSGTVPVGAEDSVGAAGHAQAAGSAAVPASAPVAMPSAAQAAPLSQSGVQVSARGCFGSAWDDLKGTPGWFGKVALMALIDLVPILNFVNVGYGLNWGRDVAFGKREPLQGKIVTGDNFKLGFFVFVIALVAGLIFGIEGALLGIIPIIGVLAGLALSIFGGMFLNLAFMRTALFGALGEGFAVSKLFEGYKRNLGTLFCVTFVPGLIAGCIATLIALVFSLIIGTIVGVDALSLVGRNAMPLGRYGYYGNYGYDYYGLGALMGGSAVILLLLVLVMLYGIMLAGRFCGLVTCRALGHYVVRFVPEWTNEARGMGSTVIAGATQETSRQGSSPVSGVQGGQPTVPTQVSQDSRTAQPSASVQAKTASSRSPQAAIPVMAPLPVTAPAQDASYYDETSVLPEENPQDLETTVQPELQPAQQPAVQPAQQTAPPPELQSMGAGVVGDDSGTTVLGMQASPSGQRALSLQITRSNGDTCVLSAFPVTIGKGTEADLRIEGNSAISRLHVRLLRDGNVFAAEDLGSTNKTFIGDYELQPSAPTILSDGDELRLGNEILRVNMV